MKEANQQLNTWEEEFNEFGDIYCFPHGMSRAIAERDGIRYSGRWTNEDIKSFIRQLLKKQETEIKEKLIEKNRENEDKLRRKKLG